VCEGHGECVTVAPELFDLGDDEGAVHVIGQPDDADLQNKARGAERVCPVGAITLLLRGRSELSTRVRSPRDHKYVDGLPTSQRGSTATPPLPG
jgi:ferredoxin